MIETISRKVVIYRLGSLGDTIVSLPCFHAIARAEPTAERIVLTNIPVSSKAAPLEAILGGSGLIHGVMDYPVGTRSLKELGHLRKRLRHMGADTLYYLTPARGMAAAWRDLVFFRLCGFKRIIGIPLRADLQRNRILPTNQYIENEASRLARCLVEIQPKIHDPSQWDLGLTDGERVAGQRIAASLSGSPFIVVNMGGKVAKNDWGRGNWCTLLSQLSQEFEGLGLLVVGAAEDSPRAQDAITQWTNGPSVDACGQLTPRESAAAMAKATLFLGHDSGPLHLAAAMQVRCLGLYGDNNPPAKWHPFGVGHQVLHRMAGVQAITVDEVLRMTRSMLKSALIEP
jgi:heptosyltransferase-3